MTNLKEEFIADTGSWIFVIIMCGYLIITMIETIQKEHLISIIALLFVGIIVMAIIKLITTVKVYQKQRKELPHGD